MNQKANQGKKQMNPIQTFVELKNMADHHNNASKASDSNFVFNGLRVWCAAVKKNHADATAKFNLRWFQIWADQLLNA